MSRWLHSILPFFILLITIPALSGQSFKDNLVATVKKIKVVPEIVEKLTSFVSEPEAKSSITPLENPTIIPHSSEAEEFKKLDFLGDDGDDSQSKQVDNEPKVDSSAEEVDGSNEKDTKGKKSTDTATAEKTNEASKDQESAATANDSGKESSPESAETNNDDDSVVTGEQDGEGKAENNEETSTSAVVENPSIGINGLILDICLAMGVIFMCFVCYYRYQLEKYKIPPFTPPVFCPNCLFPRTLSKDKLNQPEFYQMTPLDYHPPELGGF